MTTENEKEQPQKAYGLLAEYKNTTELVNAATKVRDAGYTKWDCYSPFPVHGIDPAADGSKLWQSLMLSKEDSPDE